MHPPFTESLQPGIAPAEHARDAFARCYNRPPRWIASAPGRVNLIGEFTDYNDGFVLPMAIEHRTAIAAAPNGADRIVLRSEVTGEGGGQSGTIDLSRPITPGVVGDWMNYPKGVLAGFLALGFEPCGFDAVICSNVPVGAGLSSSAALETAVATLLEAVCGVTLDPTQKAELCQEAEHVYAGVPCGIMDQFISAMARQDTALLLDCRSKKPDWVPFTDPAITVLIVNTNVRHEHSSNAYAERRRSCETAVAALGVPSLREATMDDLLKNAAGMDEMSIRCTRHVIGENERTVRAAQCIRDHDWERCGELMNASHVSLRDDYQASCVELDVAVEIAQGIGRAGGVYGSRMTGGGFGGCTIALIDTAAQQPVVAKVGAEYRRRTGIEATCFVSRPAAGAFLDMG